MSNTYGNGIPDIGSSSTYGNPGIDMSELLAPLPGAPGAKISDDAIINIPVTTEGTYTGHPDRNIYEPSRYEGESYQDYKDRRAVAKHNVKAMRKGIMFWDSHRQGTYRKTKELQ